MHGPLSLALSKSNATAWAGFAVKPHEVSKAELAEAEKMAGDIGSQFAQSQTTERTCEGEVRQLGQTRVGLDALLTKLQEQFQKLWLPSLDELIDTLDACDSLALSQRLQPHEYHIKFVSDARARVDVRIRAARLRRLEATVERCKLEALEAQLLAVISHGRTVAALSAVFSEEGEVTVIGKRTQTLRAIALSKMEAVSNAEKELRDERNRQLRAEQVSLAQGTIGRAQVAAAIS